MDPFILEEAKESESTNCDKDSLEIIDFYIMIPRGK